MSSAATAKKTAQLGIPFGTATGRLRKAVMHQLVCQAGRDRCFKCGQPITSAKELSIEHKVAWLDGGPELFWDLSNIAFSHAACNKAERFPRRIQHGTVSRYQAGCRCEPCRVAKAAAARRETRRKGHPMAGDGAALEKR